MDAYPLDYLQNGEEGRIVEIAGEERNVHRLAEIGLRTGCPVKMICSGHPCVLAVDGRRLCVRLSDEVNVWVSRESSTASGSEG